MMDKNLIRKILMEKTNRQGLPTQQEIANFLSKYYPEEKTEDKLFHDRWGLYSKNGSGIVKKILLCTTPTQPIINLAKEQGYDLVISHHDFLFNNPEVPQIIYHSSMDESDKGHNQYFLRRLGLKNLKQYHKVLVGGDLYKPLTLDEFQKLLIARGFEINGVVWESPNADNQIESVLYCSGLGGMLLYPNHIIDAKKYPADVYVTGELMNDPDEIRNNPFKYIIELGHTSSEKPLFKWIKNMLINRWENVIVDLADNSIDVWGTDNYKNKKERQDQLDKEWAERSQQYRNYEPYDSSINGSYSGPYSDENDDSFYDFSNEYSEHPLIQELKSSYVVLDDLTYVIDILNVYYSPSEIDRERLFNYLLEVLNFIDPDIENLVRENPEKYLPENY